jgi:putative polyketide hydroxylase
VPASRVPVLIIGAGLAGLSAAVLLGWRGIPCLLAERRATGSRHPRARGVNLRSMEVLRGVPGLEEALRTASPLDPDEFGIVIAESVTGRVFKTILAPRTFDAKPLSPAARCIAGQDRVEPILLRFAQQFGADIRLGTEFLSFAENNDGIEGLLRDRASGATSLVEAQYMIAADGNRSPVRRALGIGAEGRGTLSNNISILFEAAELPAVLKRNGFALYYLQNKDFTGVFVSTDDPGIGQVSVEYDPQKEPPENFNTERCADTVRAALGVPDLAPKILDVMPWEMSAQTASRMAQGRVFLAGDAAHTTPPTGGLGGQTAIQDAADLAWKLALVLRGQAGAELLATYQAERHPVAVMTVEKQTANYVERLRGDRTDLTNPAVGIDYMSVALGYHYRSAGIVPDRADDGHPAEDPSHPSGQPGSRLPHIEILHGEKTISTLDLAGRGFLLLAGKDGQEWGEAARVVAAQIGVELGFFRLSDEITESAGALAARANLAANGALLVRPDGFIAWRTPNATSDASAALAATMHRILFRDTLANAGAA